MRVRVEKLASGGIGLSHHPDGRALFIPSSLPGEEIEVVRMSEKRNYLRAEEHEVVTPSPLRIVPSCPYSGRCGGCDFDIVSAEASAALKCEIVKDNLMRIAKLQSLPPFDPPAYASAEGYRARVKLHLSLNERKAGFLSEGGRALVEVKQCPRLEGRLDALLSDPDGILKRGRMRLIEKGINRRTGYGELQLFNADDKVLFESDEGVRTIAGIGYRLRGDVFFQSNPSLLPSLFSFIRENVRGESILDLYSGVGTFSALFEGSGREVIAVEKQKECLSLSRCNAPSAVSYTGDVSLWARGRRGSVGTVIVDPPRTGLDPSIPALITSWQPQRVIYVSCDSVTLSRDIPLFSGYEAVKARVFDFYPGSGHEESAIVLERC